MIRPLIVNKCLVYFTNMSSDDYSHGPFSSFFWVYSGRKYSQKQINALYIQQKTVKNYYH